MLVSISDNVGDNIRKIRKLRGLTLKELGNMLGVSETNIRAYESGKRNPKYETIKRFASALEVDVSALRGYKEERITYIKIQGELDKDLHLV